MSETNTEQATCACGAQSNVDDIEACSVCQIECCDHCGFIMTTRGRIMCMECDGAKDATKQYEKPHA